MTATFNDGQGHFPQRQQFVTTILSMKPANLTLGDVDADGDLDVLVTYTDNDPIAPHPGGVAVCPNDGTGHFSRGQYMPVGRGPASTAMADLDGDGDLDLLTANTIDNSVSIRLNGGTGPTRLTAEVPAAAAFNAYPTPAPATAPIRLTGAAAYQQLTLLDAVGRRRLLLPTDATGAATLPAGTLAPGLYLVRTPDGRTTRL